MNQVGSSWKQLFLIIKAGNRIGYFTYVNQTHYRSYNPLCVLLDTQDVTEEMNIIRL